jgi:hypothetical protein
MSYHEDLMTGIAALLAAEGLDGIPEGRIHVRKLPDAAAVKFPCILVTLDGSRPECHPIDTEQDERVLPVSALLLDRSDRRDDSDLARWLQWLEDAVDALLMQLYDDVPECWHADVRPLDAIDAARSVGPEYSVQASGFVISPRVITGRRRPS